MTRKEIEAQYRIRNGIIVSPGKFEAEPLYVPYFAGDLMTPDDYHYDEVTETVEWESFNVTEADRLIFPELAEVVRVKLWYSDNGFIMGQTIRKGDHDA